MDFSQCLITKMEKGTYIIIVNEPVDSPCAMMINFSSADNSLCVQTMTNSVYIGKTNKQILIRARYAVNYSSESDYVKIDPDKFTKLEVNYIYDEKNRVDKVVINPTEFCPPACI